MRRLPARLLVAAGAVVLASALVVLAFLLRPDARAQTPAPAATPGQVFPAPPRGATVFSRQLGSEALALGVVPRGRRVLLQASVLGAQGAGVSGLTVTFALAGATKTATACGAGCYRATLPAGEHPVGVQVAVRGVSWRVALPAAWPPKDASALVAHASRVWRSLRSLGFSETLASDTRHRTSSRWQVEAPNRLSYTVKGGWSGIIVGSRRWDRSPGGRAWVESPQTPVTQPTPAWASVTDAHLLGPATVDGRRAWRVSFFDRGSHAWFTVWLDRSTLRTLESRMVTTAHFMDDVYDAFNAGPAVRPPR